MSTETFIEKYTRKKKEQKNTFPDIVERFKNDLKKVGLKSFSVEYAGSGDSGGIEAIHIFPEKLKDKFVLSKDHKQWDNEKMEHIRVEKEVSTESLIEDFCYDLLSTHHSGWEINAGQTGEINWDSKTNQITHNVRQYYEECNEFDEEF